MSLASIAASLGKGLFAGLVGTAAMTVSSTAEMKVRGRIESSAPADAVAKVLGIEKFTSDAATERFGNLVHWGYGTGWGAVRGLLAVTGLGPGLATAAHYAAVWSAELAMLPALKVAPPVTQWGAQEIAIDAWHHAVYATATGLAYGWLDRRG
jgi:hypothetical protein